MAFLGVGTGSIGLVAPCRFKTLDSKPVKSNMQSISIIVYLFRKVVMVSWPGIYGVFGPPVPKICFLVF